MALRGTETEGVTMALKKCRDCGNKVSSNAAACPQCGSPTKRKGGNFGLGLLMMLLACGAVCYGVFNVAKSIPSGSGAGDATDTSVAPVIASKPRPAEPVPVVTPEPPSPLPPRTPEQLRAERRAAGYVERAKKELSAGNALGAGQFLKLALDTDGVEHADALALQQTMKNADDPAWALERLAALSDDDLQKLDRGESDPAALRFEYDVLTRKAVAHARAQLGPILAERAELRRREAEAAEAARIIAEAEAKEREKEERRERIADEKRRKVEAAARAVAEREQQIRSQFDWDGSHTRLVKLVKKSMHDADSYEHVETVYTDKGDYLVILTKFRGTNALGAKVLTHVLANVSIDGAILSWEFVSP